MTCEQITALIVDYVTGDLELATTEVFEAHLRGCRDCIAFLNTYRKTIQAMRSLAYDDIPPEMLTRVQEFLLQRLKSSDPRR